MVSLDYAPVLLFTYKRFQHTLRVVNALLENDEAPMSDLVVFCDGAKGEEEKRDVEKVREYVKTISGFRSVEVKENKKNKGLARSIIDGVTWGCETYNKVIVIEDDIQVTKYFLKYMNDGLMLYKDSPAVYSIHGYGYPISCGGRESYFLKGADCWGWGTWKRAWDVFESSSETLLDEIIKRGLQKEFDLDGSYPYTGMLKQNSVGQIDSWAIRWHASVYLRNGLTLYPGKSLVRNIGFDDSGTHSIGTKVYDSTLNECEVHVFYEEPLEDNEMRSKLKEFYATNFSMWRRIVRRFISYRQRVRGYVGI